MENLYSFVAKIKTLNKQYRVDASPSRGFVWVWSYKISARAVVLATVRFISLKQLTAETLIMWRRRYIFLRYIHWALFWFFELWNKILYTVLCCCHYGSIRFVNIFSNHIVLNINCVIERTKYYFVGCCYVFVCG
jgi:hypothetical protein